MYRRKLFQTCFLLALGAALGYWSSHFRTHSRSFLSSAQAAAEREGGGTSERGKAVGSQGYSNSQSATLHLLQSPAAIASGWEESDYGLGESYYKKLKPYPPGGPGERTPLDLWRYAGRGENSWGSPVL